MWYLNKSTPNAARPRYGTIKNTSDIVFKHHQLALSIIRIVFMVLLDF